MIPTRGERNNNPGNIDRNATQWQGMARDQRGDPRFVVFTAPLWGIRALVKVLITYSNKFDAGTPRDIDTVREVVERWAPPSENVTAAYIRAVATALAVEPDQVIDLADADTLCSLTRAIIKHENGRCIYPSELIAEAVRLALPRTA